MVNDEVMVERSVLTSPDAAVAVTALGVYRCLQALRDYAILQGEIGVAVEGAALVG